MITDAAAGRALEAAHRIGREAVAAVRTDPDRAVRGWGLGYGMSGVGLYLAYLARMGGDKSLTKEAERICEQVVGALPDLPPSGGWVEGKLGGALAAVQIAHLVGRPDLMAEASRQLVGAAEGVERPDVYGGIAGAILALLWAASLTGDPALRDRADSLGQKLLARWIVPHTHGAVVLPYKPVRMPLPGFGHGASGCAVALGALAGAGRDPVYRYAARSLFAFEDSLYREAWLNWPEARLRPDEIRDATATGRVTSVATGPAHPIAWCGGKSGLLTARLLAVSRWGMITDPAGLGTEKMRDPIWRWSDRGAYDHTLCCGIGGVLELHLLAARELRHPRFGRWIESFVEDVSNMREATGSWVAAWRRERGEPSHSFLKGATGVGYALLRAGTAGRTPSQLLIGADSLQGCDVISSDRLRRYRERLLYEYWGRPTLPAFRVAVDEVCYDVGHDAGRDISLLRSKTLALAREGRIPVALVEAAAYRGRLERTGGDIVSPAESVPSLRALNNGAGTRYGLPATTRAFEADSAAYVVGGRAGLGALVCVNQPATRVLGLLRQPRTLADVVDDLARISPDAWEPTTVSDFLAYLVSLGIVHTEGEARNG